MYLFTYVLRTYGFNQYLLTCALNILTHSLIYLCTRSLTLVFTHLCFISIPQLCIHSLTYSATYNAYVGIHSVTCFLIHLTFNLMCNVKCNH